jgi:ABC-2 type transport system permease protein
MNTNIEQIAATESRAERITRVLGRILGRWGVDPLQYHCLLQCSLKMDFRSTNPLAKGRSETKSALRQTMVMNLIVSGLMSFFMANIAGCFFYTTLMIGYAMAMQAMMILMEFGMVVISPDDYLTLAHRPISSRTFFAVRFSNLMFYVLVLSLSLGALPAFAGLLCRDGRWYFPVVYLLVSTAAAVFTAGAVVAFFGFFMRWLRYERLKDAMVYLQIAMSFLFFFGYQLLPRMAGSAREIGIEQLTHGWGAIMPPVWFAGLLELVLGRWTWESALTGGAALVVMAIVMPWLFKTISLDYSEQVGRMMLGSGKPAKTGSGGVHKKTFTGWLSRMLCKDIEQRAYFSFILTMLRKNRQLKLRLYPNFGIIVAMLVLGIVDQKRMPHDAFSLGENQTLNAFATMTFIMGAMVLATVLPYSDEYAGAWLFHVAPLASPRAILKAVKKVAMLFLFAPLFLCTTCVFSFFWPVYNAVEFALCGMLIGTLALQIALLRFHDFPFSMKPEKGTQTRQYMLMMLGFVFAAWMLMPLLFLCSQIVVLGACAALLAGNLLLGSYVNRRFTIRRSDAE